MTFETQVTGSPDVVVAETNSFLNLPPNKGKTPGQLAMGAGIQELVDGFTTWAKENKYTGAGAVVLNIAVQDNLAGRITFSINGVAGK